MLAMSPLLCPTFEWEYPIELETYQALFDDFDFDSEFITNNIPLSSSQAHHDYHEQESNDLVKLRSESPQGTSSTDHQCDNNPVLAKKLNHNASERDRRKKINSMYSSLRALLPGIDHRKKLSIPLTIGRVLEYIPELQKEVENLTHKKEVFLSKISALQGNNVEEMFQEEKPKPKPNNLLIKETTSCSISTHTLGDKEMVIQISAFEIMSISEVLLLLEKNGFLVIDVSSFQSFGGTTFYNLHLWEGWISCNPFGHPITPPWLFKMEGSCNVNLEKLNEVLLSLIQKQKEV